MAAGGIDAEQLAAAATALRAGRVVLHPTEAVWGLACDPFDPDAIARVYAVKQRPPDKGLILVADDFGKLRPLLATLPDTTMRAALSSWPGPHTWIVPVSPECPAWLAGGRGTLAVRISAHPVVRALSDAFDGPLVSTSANRSGDPAPRTLRDVDASIRDGVDAVLTGETDGLAKPTTIRNILTGETVRD